MLIASEDLMKVNRTHEAVWEVNDTAYQGHKNIKIDFLPMDQGRKHQECAWNSEPAR
jgi:hypothetical protein